MDKKLAGLLGAAAALATMTSAQAAAPQQTEMAPVTSYGDLLDPVPNALSQLKADNAKRGEVPTTEVAQVSVQVGHHHHHHHGVVVRLGRGHHHYHHHHHHHHHHD
jgi:hypothetical protein